MPGGGREASRQIVRAGRLPKVDARHLRQLKRMPLAGAEVFGCPALLWACPHVTEVIEAEFVVLYHPGHL